MTFAQMYSLFQTLYDKSASPYVPEIQFDQIANLAYGDWVESEYRKIEQNQEHTSRIRNLYRRFTKLNTDTISLPADLPDFRYLIRFTSKYRLNCNGVITYPEPPIVKAQNDDIDEMQDDPFNKGVEAEPTYIQSESGGVPIWKVYAGSTPLQLSGTYIRIPQVINAAGSPGTVFEQPNYIAEEVVLLAVKKTEVVIENYNRMKAEQQEIQQRMS